LKLELVKRTTSMESKMPDGSDLSQMAEQAQMQKQQEDAMEEQRKSILDQILEPEAKERLARLAIVKQDKARAVELMLIQAAQTGKLQGKVTEGQLINMLESAQGQEKQTKVTINRRKYFDDDEDDDNDDDLLG